MTTSASILDRPIYLQTQLNFPPDTVRATGKSVNSGWPALVQRVSPRPSTRRIPEGAYRVSIIGE